MVEATIAEIQAALSSKRTTSRELVTQYLVRIAAYDRVLHALITVNPKALAEADERDRERAAGAQQRQGPFPPGFDPKAARAAGVRTVGRTRNRVLF